MTDMPPLSPDDEDDLLAAEYVSGLLDLPEWTAAAARLRNDPRFAARVASWEQRLGGLNDDYPEVAAPNLLPQIEARLFPTAPRTRPLRAFWAWGATAAAALAVVAYLALTPPLPSFTATLVADGTPLRYEAVIVQDKLTITRVAGDPADADHSHELWIIAGDNPPVSLGVLPDDTETISLPGVQPGEILAVTLEQRGGSPTGKPTGAPVVLGALLAT
jgi:anti-sigma-K factor RskA